VRRHFKRRVMAVCRVSHAGLLFGRNPLIEEAIARTSDGAVYGSTFTKLHPTGQFVFNAQKAKARIGALPC
jgi:hypothetical protein